MTRFTRILSGTVSALLLFPALTGCSLITKTTGQKSERDEVTLQIPQDRRPVVPPRKSPTYSPEELKSGQVKGDWVIEQVNGRPAVGEEAPFIKFEPTQGRIYGSNGCNVLNGAYKCSPKDSTLSFSDIVTTMRACSQAGITDIEINQALNRTSRYSWSHNDDLQYFLYLKDASGTLLMTLMHQNFAFLNGTWLVETVKDFKVNAGGTLLEPDMKLVIDVDEGKVHGNTGCNILNGAFEVDMERPNSISFRNLACTMKACPDKDGNLEREFLVALEEVTTAHAVDRNRVELLDSSNRVILTLTRTSDD